MSPRSRLYKTEAIVLRGLDLGEADRVLTVLTPHLGKLRVIAKGVRRIEALTGTAAQAAIETADRIDRQIKQAANLDEGALEREVASLNDEIDALTMSVVRRAELKEQLGGLQERAKAARKRLSISVSGMRLPPTSMSPERGMTRTSEALLGSISCA